MHLATALVSLSFVCLFFYCLSGNAKIRRNGQPLRRPPNTLPFVGNGLVFIQARHKLFAWFVKCERQFGFETFQISVPTLPPGVVINDPKNLEFVLRHEKNDGDFAKGDFFKRRSFDLFGNGIINADGELWKVQRKAGLHFLTNANLKILTDVALPRYLKDSIRSLRSVTEQQPIDLEEIFLELTTQIMGKMAYNMEIHNSDSFSAAFDFASGETGKRFQNPLWQLTEPIFGRKFRQSVSVVHKFGSAIVRNAIHARKNIPTLNRVIATVDQADLSIESISGSLINSLLDSIDDEDLVADAALNYLSAGRDTVAQGLTWTFYLLMRHRDIMDLVWHETSTLIQRNELSKKNGELDTTILSSASLPYVTAVFYESLRLYPPIPFEIKQCQQATTLPDGTFLPIDSIVLWCTWAMNRSSSIWGSDANEFKPARWLENGSLITKTAFEYPVFHAGPRMCLGKKMAETIAVMVIATLVYQFNFESIDKKERISKNSLTLPMEGGLPCRVRPRLHPV